MRTFETLKSANSDQKLAVLITELPQDSTFCRATVEYYRWSVEYTTNTGLKRTIERGRYDQRSQIYVFLADGERKPLR